MLLVLGAVVLGARVVRAADDTSRTTRPARTLVPGDRVGPDDVASSTCGSTESADGYVGARDADLAPGTVAIRTVGEGELLPRAAVGTRATSRCSRWGSRSRPRAPRAR